MGESIASCNLYSTMCAHGAAQHGHLDDQAHAMQAPEASAEATAGGTEATGAKRGREGIKKLKPYTPAKMVGRIIHPVHPDIGDDLSDVRYSQLCRLRDPAHWRHGTSRLASAVSSVTSKCKSQQKEKSKEVQPMEQPRLLTPYQLFGNNDQAMTNVICLCRLRQGTLPRRCSLWRRCWVRMRRKARLSRRLHQHRSLHFLREAALLPPRHPQSPRQASSPVLSTSIP